MCIVKCNLNCSIDQVIPLLYYIACNNRVILFYGNKYNSYYSTDQMIPLPYYIACNNRVILFYGDVIALHRCFNIE